LPAIGGAAVGFFGIVGGLVAWYWYFKGELGGKEYRDETANALTSHPWATTYHERVGSALAWLDDHMGELGSWRGASQGLVVCIAVSMAYAALSFVAGWMVGGPGVVGRTKLLPSLPSAPAQLFWGFALLSVSTVCGATMACSAYIDVAAATGIARRLKRFVGDTNQRRAPWLYFVGGTIAAASFWMVTAVCTGYSTGLAVTFAITVAFAVAFFGKVAGAEAVSAGLGAAFTGAFAAFFAAAFAVAPALPVAVAGAVAVAVATAIVGVGAVSAALAGTGAFAIAGAVAVAITVAEATAAALPVVAAAALPWIAAVAIPLAGALATAWLIANLGDPRVVAVLLFFFALPVINALLDCPSWWVSRALGRHLLGTLDNAAGRGRKTLVLAVHMAADLIAAVALLYLLAMALPFMIELFNLACRGFGLQEPLQLRSFLAQAVQRPWPNGIWVLVMLLSTLVPTALHAMVPVASPLMVWLGSDRKRQAIAAGLRANHPQPWAIRKASWHLVWTCVIGIAAPLALAATFVVAIGEIWRPVGDMLLGAANRGMAGAFHVANALGWITP